MLGGKCVFVDSYPDFELPVEGIKRAISDRTKMIIVNSPCNPTGAVYSAESLKELAEIAAKKNIVILTDEIYEKFCYDQGRFPSIAKYSEDVVLLRGFSKSYAMTGWRIGYAATPGKLKAVIDAMAKIQQYTFVCAPTPFQKAAMAAMDYDVSEFVASYRQEEGFALRGAEGKVRICYCRAGAFYLFVKAPERFRDGSLWKRQ